MNRRIERYLLGLADAAEIAELESALATEPELRQAYLEAVRLDANLRDLAQESDLPPVRRLLDWHPGVCGSTGNCGLADESAPDCHPRFQ